MKTIVVGLDGSKRQPSVLRTATQVARATGAKLVLLRAVPVPSELPPRIYGVAPDDVGPILLADANSELALVAKDVPAELLQHAHARLGSPWRVLVDESQKLGADLVVIGSHGYDALDHLLGTTAGKVVNHARCSVLVAR
jgi:nucleotide-binding universal stress UspA family protein